MVSADQGIPQKRLGSVAPIANKLQRDGQSTESLGKEALQFGPDLFIGAGEGVWDMVSGMADMVIHPIRTAKGMWYLATKLVTQPGPTLKLLGHALVDPYVQAWESGHPGRAIGMGVVEVGSLFITPGEVATVARGGAAFAGAAFNGVRAGEGLRAALQGATVAGEYSMKATSAARAAERLAQLGHAAESQQMAIYAKDALRASSLAEGARADTLAHLLARIAPDRTITVAGTAMKYGDFLSYSRKLVGWGGVFRLTGRVPKGVYAAASDASQAKIATQVAEEVLAGGSKRPDLLAQIGRGLMRNPQMVGPFTPMIGLLPQTLGRIGALPKNLPSGAKLTPAIATTIAGKYHLQDTVSNVQGFIKEVSGYQGNTIGPDTANPQQIKELQALLKLAGYSVWVSGSWDTATTNAVIAFKRDNGIHQTYRLANGQFAVNEYADTATINLLLSKANDPAVKQAASATLGSRLTAAPKP